MKSHVTNLDLTLAILSWRQPKTLKNALESYQRNGLLELAKEKLIFFNEISMEDRLIAKKYGFTILSSKRNIGISIPFQQLVKAATAKYFLFLENDFMLIEGFNETKSHILAAIQLLEEGGSCIRLRHRRHYGDPNYWLQKYWLGQRDLTSPNLNSVYLLDNPEDEFPEIKKVTTRLHQFYSCSSKYASYTNNPCLYKSAFLKEHFQDASFKNMDTLEGAVSEWWEGSDFTVFQGKGLFKHHPIEVSGSGFLHHKRVKHAIKHWSHYLIRIGCKRGVINLFLLQFLPMLIKTNINFGNKVMINLSLGRYESA